MRVFISPSKFAGGPQVFKERLAVALAKHTPATITRDINTHFDIGISFINMDKHKKPQLLRLDGCYYVDNRIPLNADIIKSFRHANEVVFQSKFSRKMCSNILKISAKKCPVIYNGLDFDFVGSVKPDPAVPPGSFVACADWRDNKRPRSTVLGFLEATTTEHLYMIGDGVKDPVKHSRVHYLGKLRSEQIIAIMKSCRYQIHLCHIDSCPNAVIEGLVCGLNVLCSNLGGTPEIVNDDGVIINSDKWDWSIISKKHKFDTVKPSLVAAGIEKLKTKQRPIRADLNIENVAKKYYTLLESMLWK